MVAPRKYNREELERFFSLDTGSPSGISWKVSRPGRKVGSVAGWKNHKRCGAPSGWRVELNGRTYYAHRIILTLLQGEIPKGYVVNHIDTNPFNNKIENLELCTSADNSRRNKTFIRGDTYKNNKTGITGVHINKNNLAVASWRDENSKVCNKAFSISKYGHYAAIEMASEYRDKQIQNLRDLGINYPEKFKRS